MNVFQNLQHLRFCLFDSVFEGHHECAVVPVGRSEDSCGNQFFPSTTRVLGLNHVMRVTQEDDSVINDDYKSEECRLVTTSSHKMTDVTEKQYTPIFYVCMAFFHPLFPVI